MAVLPADLHNSGLRLGLSILAAWQPLLGHCLSDNHFSDSPNHLDAEEFLYETEG